MDETKMATAYLKAFQPQFFIKFGEVGRDNSIPVTLIQAVDKALKESKRYTTFLDERNSTLYVKTVKQVTLEVHDGVSPHRLRVRPPNKSKP